MTFAIEVLLPAIIGLAGLGWAMYEYGYRSGLAAAAKKLYAPLLEEVKCEFPPA
jgi:hypothetical protein